MAEVRGGLAVPLSAAGVDAGTIRETCEAVLWASPAVRAEDRAGLSDLLRAHVQFLLSEVAAAAPGMAGEWQPTAVHVVTRTRRMLECGVGASAMDVWNLATQCRALLALYQRSAPVAGGYLAEVRS